MIHKKDVTDNPANFRPITLESVPLKVFTSCLRNKIFAFLSENNYIEHDIQKGFTPNVAGTVEHTAHMAHIINTARIKQRSLVITLLDLKNAFGELHHNLIYKILQYHHIPDPINELIRSLYTNFQTSIITEKFSIPFITVGRGVLQGDSLVHSFSICPLIPSYNTLNLNHSCSLVFGNLIKLVFRVIQFIGSSLQTTRLLLVAKKKKIKSYSTASRYGVNGPI